MRVPRRRHARDLRHHVSVQPSARRVSPAGSHTRDRRPAVDNGSPALSTASAAVPFTDRHGRQHRTHRDTHRADERSVVRGRCGGDVVRDRQPIRAARSSASSSVSTARWCRAIRLRRTASTRRVSRRAATRRRRRRSTTAHPTLSTATAAVPFTIGSDGRGVPRQLGRAASPSNGTVFPVRCGILVRTRRTA